MKKETKFIVTVISSLLVAAFILAGCMKTISESTEEPKNYDMDIVSQAVSERGDSNVIETTPTPQNDMQKKFSDMSVISESGKSITVISQEYLDNYWKENENKQVALTASEVLYIIQDSIKLYFEYDECILIGSAKLREMHPESCYFYLLNGNYALKTISKNALGQNYVKACYGIQELIFYRLTALSSRNAFVYYNELLSASNGMLSTEYHESSPFYIPEHENDGLTREEWLEIVLSDGAVPEHLPWLQYFNLNAYGSAIIEHFATDKAHVRIFPTAEMESSQANKVVAIEDRTEAADAALEPFWQDDNFVYYFPSIKSKYVFAIMGDGREMLLVDALKLGYITPKEFDNFDFDYIRHVKFEEKDTEYAFPFSGFTWETVMTDKLRTDGIFPYANIFNSASQLNEYTKEIEQNNIYNIKNHTALIPSYKDWVQKYTDSWFEKNTLIVAVVEADSEFLPKPKLTYIRTGGTVTVYMDEETLGNKSDQVYTVFIETLKIDALDAEVVCPEYEGETPIVKPQAPPCGVVEIINPDGLFPDEVVMFWETDKFSYFFNDARDLAVKAVLSDGTEMLLTEALEQGYITPEHFDALGLQSYHYTIKHDYVGGKYYFPINVPSSQAVLVGELKDNTDLPHVKLINSSSQLTAYSNELTTNQIYDLDKSNAVIPSYNEWIAKYRGDWFDKNSLVIAFVKADVESLPQIVFAYVETGGTVTVELAKETFADKGAQLYAMFIEMPKIDAEKVEAVE